MDGRTTGGPDLRLGPNHTGRGAVHDALLQQAHKYNRRVAYAHLAVELRRVFALYSFVPPEQLLWRQSHRAPQNTKPAHVQLSLFSVLFFLTAQIHTTVYNGLFLACSLNLRLSSYVALFYLVSLNFPMPLSFRLGDSSRSVYPVVSLEWSGVSLTEYSLRMVSPIFTLVLAPIGYIGPVRLCLCGPSVMLIAIVECIH